MLDFVVEPACSKARHSCNNFYSVNMYALLRACVRPSGFVRVITSTFMHGFQNNLTQLLFLRKGSAIWNNFSGRLKFKVTLEGVIN